MPVYEYRCPKCGTISEDTRKIDDRDKPFACPKCGASTERVLSGFATKIGFYVRPPVKPKKK